MLQKAIVFKQNNKIDGYIRLLRVKQWIKNTFVFAALIFSRNMFNEAYFNNALLSFISFCLISSCVYIFNDMADAERDKMHYKKKNRPIAAGIISKKEATFLLLILLVIGMVMCVKVNKNFSMIILLYLLNNIIYTYKLKNIVIIDIMSISLGFILRVIGGAVAINVSISPWLLMCTLFLSLFLGFSKRRNEIIILKDHADQHRSNLKEYSIEFIDSMLSVITASTVISYSLYTFLSSEQKNLMLTIPFVLYGIFRYQYIIYMKNGGGSPEETILLDKPLLIDMLLWVISCLIILY